MFEERKHEKEKRGEYFQGCLNEEQLLDEMESNKRSFLGITIENSRSYDKVKEKLHMLTINLDKPIYNKTDDAEGKSDKIQNMYITIKKSYDELCISCVEYLDTHRGIRWTSSGRARRSLIEEIYDQAISEEDRLSQLGVKGVQKMYGYLPEITFKDILKDLRTEVIDITGREDIEKFGGVTSSGVAIGDGEDKRFFKPKEDGSLQESFNGRSCELSEYMREYNRIIELRRMAYGVANIPIDARIDIRNVATSRLFEALGEQDLVAKSRLAVLREEGVPDKEGIIMSKVKGKSLQQLSKDLRFFAEQAVMGQGIYQIRLSKDVQRKFANLQLGDYIAGQVGGRLSDLLLNYEIYDMGIGAGTFEVYITSIQGIDNYMSFGLRNIRELLKGRYLLPDFHDSQGNLSLPYIDKDFYNRLLGFQNLSERGMMGYIFADLLTERERQALQNRFEGMEKAVLQLYNRTDRLLDRDKWDQTSLEATLASDNYLSRFINYVRSILIGSDVPIISD